MTTYVMQLNEILLLFTVTIQERVIMMHVRYLNITNQTNYYRNWSMCSELAVAATLARVLLLQSKGEEDFDKWFRRPSLK